MPDYDYGVEQLLAKNYNPWCSDSSYFIRNKLFC